MSISFKNAGIKTLLSRIHDEIMAQIFRNVFRTFFQPSINTNAPYRVFSSGLNTPLNNLQYRRSNLHKQCQSLVICQKQLHRNFTQSMQVQKPTSNLLKHPMLQHNVCRKISFSGQEVLDFVFLLCLLLSFVSSLRVNRIAIKFFSLLLFGNKSVVCSW